jgi:putative sigma-54 modulation protein
MSKSNKIINFNITFRNIEATDAIRNHATEKLGNVLQKLLHRDAEPHVVLRVEKNRQIAEISLNADGTSISCREESDNLYSAIDMLVDNLSVAEA